MPNREELVDFFGLHGQTDQLVCFPHESRRDMSPCVNCVLDFCYDCLELPAKAFVSFIGSRLQALSEPSEPCEDLATPWHTTLGICIYHAACVFMLSPNLAMQRAS